MMMKFSTIMLCFIAVNGMEKEGPGYDMKKGTVSEEDWGKVQVARMLKRIRQLRAEEREKHRAQQQDVLGQLKTRFDNLYELYNTHSSNRKVFHDIWAWQCTDAGFVSEAAAEGFWLGREQDAPVVTDIITAIENLELTKLLAEEDAVQPGDRSSEEVEEAEQNVKSAIDELYLKRKCPELGRRYDALNELYRSKCFYSEEFKEIWDAYCSRIEFKVNEMSDKDVGICDAILAWIEGLRLTKMIRQKDIDCDDSKIDSDEDSAINECYDELETRVQRRDELRTRYDSLKEYYGDAEKFDTRWKGYCKKLGKTENFRISDQMKDGAVDLCYVILNYMAEKEGAEWNDYGGGMYY